MKLHIILLSTCLSITLALSSLHVQAHGDHDHEDNEKLIPKSCAELADTKKYTNDVAYPQVKELKARCDAEAKKPAK